MRRVIQVKKVGTKHLNNNFFMVTATDDKRFIVTAESLPPEVGTLVVMVPVSGSGMMWRINETSSKARKPVDTIS